MDLPVVAISAKMGTNLTELLTRVRELYDEALKAEESLSSNTFNSEI